MSWLEKLAELDGKRTQGKWKIDGGSAQINAVSLLAFEEIGRIGATPNAEFIVFLANNAQKLRAVVEVARRVGNNLKSIQGRTPHGTQIIQGQARDLLSALDAMEEEQ